MIPYSSSQNIVTQSNSLIEMPYKLSNKEITLIRWLVSNIHKDDDSFKIYTLKITDYMHFLGIKNKREYKDMKLLTKGLMKKGFEVRDGNRTLQINWFASAEYFDKEGIVQIEFSQKLRPYLLQLKSCFTPYEFGQIKNMRGQYSIRIYELLKQYQNIPSKCRSFSLDKLRNILGIEELQYPNYFDFKKRTILTAKKEMEEFSDISFDLEEIKDGKKVVELKFYIKDNSKKIDVTPLEIIASNNVKTTKAYAQQAGNFEQRQYTDEFYDSIYENAK